MLAGRTSMGLSSFIRKMIHWMKERIDVHRIVNFWMMTNTKVHKNSQTVFINSEVLFITSFM